MLWSKSSGTVSQPASPTRAAEIGENAKDGIYLISELAQEVGLDAKTIRFYERVGLLAPSVHGRMRVYSPDDAKRLFSIKKLRQFGFSIAKIKAIRALEGDLTFKHIPGHKTSAMICAQLEDLRLEQERMMSSISELEHFVSLIATQTQAA